jgi:chromate transport protein ChrA
LVTFAYESFSENVFVARAIRGALAATAGLTLVTAIQLLRPHMNKQRYILPVAVALLSLLLVWKFAFPPVLVLGVAAVLGYFLPARESA